MVPQWLACRDFRPVVLVGSYQNNALAFLPPSSFDIRLLGRRDALFNFIFSKVHQLNPHQLHKSNSRTNFFCQQIHSLESAMAQPSPIEKGWCAVDNTFGPAVTDCCGNFDFTLLFEESILSILPSAIFLLIVPSRLLHVYRGSKKVRRSLLQILKMVSFNETQHESCSLLRSSDQLCCVFRSANRVAYPLGKAWPFAHSNVSCIGDLGCSRCCSDRCSVIFLSQSLSPTVNDPADIPFYFTAV